MVHILDLQFLGQPKTIAAFLIETPQSPILVETGAYSTFKNLEKAVQQVGFSLEEIKHVFVTHIHLDHAGAAWVLAEKGANIYVHPFGAKHLIDPSKLMDSAKQIYQDQMDSLWGLMHAIPENQVYAVAHEEVIQVGNVSVKAWHTPGHAVHHIAWQINEHLFAGDVAGVKIEDGMVVPPCPPPDINVEDWQNSIAMMRRLPITDLYLTHFGKVTQIEQHLNDLESNLIAWANWVKPHFEAGRKPIEVVPEFQQYVKKLLLDNGVPDHLLKQYEGANPSFMSVAGLMRYWKKKEG